ncbi:MAG: bis(5'-nucleosyl)-tetraphosphatase (symmetrical) YqeK [Candidatus Gastranaerophilales bacterium]|nr:bis(5'-nucleosyl)-tetraphosphatase (symmetrical) YqeK [Candidatus Gastranaerophilales bacterium]
MKNIDYIKDWLKKNLSSERYSHSLGCAQSAYELAKYYDLDSKKAYLAGLVHDCAKNMNNDTLLDLIKNEIKEGFLSCELKNPKVYHAIAGPYIAKKEFEIDDKVILNAIRRHTIGSLDMTLFDKIIFLADKIEPNTRDFEYSKVLYGYIQDNSGIKGLDTALLKCYSETIKSLVNRKLYICPVTIDVYNNLQENVRDLLTD